MIGGPEGPGIQFEMARHDEGGGGNAEKGEKGSVKFETIQNARTRVARGKEGNGNQLSAMRQALVKTGMNEEEARGKNTQQLIEELENRAILPEDDPNRIEIQGWPEEERQLAQERKEAIAQRQAGQNEVKTEEAEPAVVHDVEQQQAVEVEADNFTSAYSNLKEAIQTRTIESEEAKDALADVLRQVPGLQLDESAEIKLKETFFGNENAQGGIIHEEGANSVSVRLTHSGNLAVIEVARIAEESADTLKLQIDTATGEVVQGGVTFESPEKEGKLLFDREGKLTEKEGDLARLEGKVNIQDAVSKLTSRGTGQVEPQQFVDLVPPQVVEAAETSSLSRDTATVPAEQNVLPIPEEIDRNFSEDDRAKVHEARLNSKFGDRFKIGDKEVEYVDLDKGLAIPKIKEQLKEAVRSGGNRAAYARQADVPGNSPLAYSYKFRDVATGKEYSLGSEAFDRMISTNPDIWSKESIATVDAVDPGTSEKLPTPTPTEAAHKPEPKPEEKKPGEKEPTTVEEKAEEFYRGLKVGSVVTEAGNRWTLEKINLEGLNPLDAAYFDKLIRDKGLGAVLTEIPDLAPTFQFKNQDGVQNVFNTEDVRGMIRSTLKAETKVEDKYTDPSKPTIEAPKVPTIAEKLEERLAEARENPFVYGNERFNPISAKDFQLLKNYADLYLTRNQDRLDPSSPVIEAIIKYGERDNAQTILDSINMHHMIEEMKKSGFSEREVAEMNRMQGIIRKAVIGERRGFFKRTIQSELERERAFSALTREFQYSEGRSPEMALAKGLAETRKESYKTFAARGGKPAENLSPEILAAAKTAQNLLRNFSLSKPEEVMKVVNAQAEKTGRQKIGNKEIFNALKFVGKEIGSHKKAALIALLLLLLFPAIAGTMALGGK